MRWKCGHGMRRARAVEEHGETARITEQALSALARDRVREREHLVDLLVARRRLARGHVRLGPRQHAVLGHEGHDGRAQLHAAPGAKREEARRLEVDVEVARERRGRDHRPSLRGCAASRPRSIRLAMPLALPAATSAGEAAASAR